uniref:Ember n=1 Tax=Anthoathecata sp. MH-2011 TaxID=1088796 RepID=G4WMX3_9CNID|nr:ember [Anthoathecata sp. MH-2011]
METGRALFSKPMTCQTEIDGEINGNKFKVVGNGDSPGGGDFSIHAYCTTGELPMSWVVLGSPLQYGFHMFSGYPDDIIHYFQECFPEGYILTRSLRFEYDGTLTTTHHYSLEGNCVKAKVTLKGEGFDPNGPTMTKEFEEQHPSQVQIFPHGSGIRLLSNVVFKKKDGTTQLALQDCSVKPLGSRDVPLPNVHFLRTQIIQKKDDSDKRDHVVQREIAIAEHPFLVDNTRGRALFSNSMTSKTEIDGEINGKKFKVVGEGDSPGGGDFTIRAYCTTGELPMSWVVMGSPLQYGFHMLSHYPDDIVHYFQECFPEGYTLTRKLRFEGDGTLTTHHRYELAGTCVKAKVSLTGESFDPSGPTMTKTFVEQLPNQVQVFPHADGIRLLSDVVFVKNDGTTQIAHQDCSVKPLATRKITLPRFHFLHTQISQWKDRSDKRDHVVQREVSKAELPFLVENAVQGRALFSNPMTSKTEIDGEINGKKFKVVGEGDSPGGGDFTMHAYCTTGELPMSWVVMGSPLQYGFHMFSHYPDEIVHYFQECFPEGYTLTRTLRFEGDGTLTTHHQYQLAGTCVKAKVSLKGESFDLNGPTMTKTFVEQLPSQVQVFPHADGIRLLSDVVFVKNDGTTQIAYQDCTVKPLGTRKISLPEFHFLHVQISQRKDSSDPRDHVVQREVAKAQHAVMVKTGRALFSKPMTSKTDIDGEINGQKFRVIGEGKSPGGGDYTMNAYCASGKLPMSWVVLGSPLQYGFHMFAHYPEDIIHFFEECFPEGYTLTRTLRFENDGTLTTHHKYELIGTCMEAKVTLNGVGFDPDGPTMTDGFVEQLAGQMLIYPYGDGIRLVSTVLYVKKDGSTQVGFQDSKLVPVGKRKITQPKVHFVLTQILQKKDASDKRDHVIQREVSRAWYAEHV